MNTLSHIRMGSLLCEYVRENYGIRLDRRSFIYGNVLPDYEPVYIAMSHVAGNWSPYVERIVSGLLELKQGGPCFNRGYSRNLGVICHFYADFFCFPHSRNYFGSSAAHMRYEWDLHRYARDKYGILKETAFNPELWRNIDAGVLFRRFEKLQEEYLGMEQSFDSDLVCSFLACVEAITLITGSSGNEESAQSDMGDTVLHTV